MHMPTTNQRKEMPRVPGKSNGMGTTSVNPPSKLDIPPTTAANSHEKPGMPTTNAKSSYRIWLEKKTQRLADSAKSSSDNRDGMDDLQFTYKSHDEFEL